MTLSLISKSICLVASVVTNKNLLSQIIFQNKKEEIEIASFILKNVLSNFKILIYLGRESFPIHWFILQVLQLGQSWNKFEVHRKLY